MSDTPLQVDISKWVLAAKADPAKHLERQATEILLAAVGMANAYGSDIVLKGGVQMGIIFNSPRQTADIDFTALMPPSESLLDDLPIALNDTLLQAAARLGYPDLIMKIQTIQPKPRKDSLAKGSWPAISVTVAYAVRGTGHEKRLHDGNATQVLHLDLSFNEPVYDVEFIRLGDGVEIATYSLVDIVSEKLRALLQQVKRKRNRRQDIYDLVFLITSFEFTAQDNKKVFQSFMDKCHARSIEPEKHSFRSEKLKEMASVEWDTLTLELEDVPDFEDCFNRVVTYYESLPWEC